jgi:hypothetical protein
MSLNHRLVNHGHVRRFVVTPIPAGWDVREEEDSTVVRHAQRTDWHRVETDAHLFEIKVPQLRREGWIDD